MFQTCLSLSARNRNNLEFRLLRLLINLNSSQCTNSGVSVFLLGPTIYCSAKRFYPISIYVLFSAQYGDSVTLNRSVPLALYAWNTSNCTGSLAWTPFNDTVMALNLSNWQISRSFTLSRALQDQEQLDLSTASNFSS
jgi:hypothetical protein